MSDDEQDPPEAPEDELAEQKDCATYNDYIGVMQALFEGELRRDVFTQDLHFKDKRGKWCPILGELPLAKFQSVCHDLKGFSSNKVAPHVGHYTGEQPGKLLIDLPAWDGASRLDVIGQCLTLKNLSQEHATELLKDWGVKLFCRLYEPIIQNRILVIKGNQGCGKDYLVHQMLAGLGSYVTPWINHSQEKDTLELLSNALVCHIAEYDRIHKTEVSALKNYITMSHVRFRGAYARKAEERSVRASFIATCNVDSILRDFTGNRRYIIFDVENLDWNYPLGDSLQILAEWKALSTKGFRASKASEDALAEYLLKQTPANPEEDMCEDYEQIYKDTHWNENRTQSSEMEALFEKIRKLHGYSTQRVREVLRRHNYGGHIKTGTVFGGKPGNWQIPPSKWREVSEESEPVQPQVERELWPEDDDII